MSNTRANKLYAYASLLVKYDGRKDKTACLSAHGFGPGFEETLTMNEFNYVISLCENMTK